MAMDNITINPILPPSTHVLFQGNAGVFEACVAGLTEPQKLAVQGILQG